MSDITTVVVSRYVIKRLKKLPVHITLKLEAWVAAVGKFGLLQVRKVTGYHDEPLKGNRKGQRSIRLSKAYRAIYEINSKGELKFIEIIEVNKHEY